MLGALGARGVGLVAAVRPWDLPEVAALGRACAREGVELALWPMLDDADGRWLSSYNAAAFVRFAREVTARAEPAPAAVAFDMEPPIALARAALSGRAGSMARQLFALRRGVDAGADAWRREVGGLVEELGARDVEAHAVVLPPMLARGVAERVCARVLGTPLAGVRWSRVNVMLYTSLIEGWSRGLVSRGRAERLLAAGCARARAKLGERASVSLGAVGVGALGSEPVYRGPAELAADVAIARANGVDDLVLLDLGGVLARPPVEAWLDAFASGVDRGSPHR